MLSWSSNHIFSKIEAVSCAKISKIMTMRHKTTKEWYDEGH